VKRTAILAVLMTLVGASCLGGGGNERTILVDFSHDEFASAMFDNFPGEVQVPQGANVVFKQIWTGEPHTVTGGALVNEMMTGAAPWMEFFERFESLLGSGADVPDPENPPDAPFSEFLDQVRAADDEDGPRTVDAYEAVTKVNDKVPTLEEAEDISSEKAIEIIDVESEKIFEEQGIPWAFEEDDEGNGFIAQNAGQPCFLTKGAPPKDPKKACADADQEQPAFDGKASYYNSGIIPYEGQQGNTFNVQLADDVEPGDYWFYCAVHGPGQSTKLKVVEEGTEVPSQEAVNRKAREEIDTFAQPMLKAFRDARDGEVEAGGEKVEGPFAGLTVPVHGILNEFVPKRITTDVGEPVTWKVMGADHTISFDVPEYFPIVEFRKDGEVRLNPKLEPPAGGSPDLPKREEGPPGEGPPVEIDAGTYDGTGFWSSGMIGGEPFAEYTLRFSKPGTYRYACLIHPPMVGTVVVN
jgi:plastocyanin